MDVNKNTPIGSVPVRAIVGMGIATFSSLPRISIASSIDFKPAGRLLEKRRTNLSPEIVEQSSVSSQQYVTIMYVFSVCCKHVPNCDTLPYCSLNS